MFNSFTLLNALVQIIYSQKPAGSLIDIFITLLREHEKLLRKKIHVEGPHSF
jgi:hypothetical protein